MDRNFEKSPEVKSIVRRLFSDPAFSQTDYFVLIHLILFKTRTKTILSILRGSALPITETDIGRLYKAIHNESSKQGQETFTAGPAIATLEKRAHSSYYAARLQTFQRVYGETPLSHVMAYFDYLEAFEQKLENPTLSFTLCYRVGQMIQSGSELRFTRCTDCRGKYLEDPMRIATSNVCPICNIRETKRRQNLKLVESTKARSA